MTMFNTTSSTVTNTSVTTSHNQQQDSTSLPDSGQVDLKTVSLILYTILLLVGTSSNVTVPVRVLRDKTLHNPTFVVISSLAVADLLFICWRIPMEILRTLSPNWTYGTAVCKLSYLFYQVSSYSAAYHLVLLSGVRYYTLVHPFQALQHLTIKTVGIMCGLLWTFIFFSISTLLFTSGVVELNYEGMIYYVCIPDPGMGIRSVRIYSWCYSVFSYFLPLTILIVFHISKACTVASAAHQMQDKRIKQMSAMVVLVLVLFGGLLLPVHVKNILHNLGVLSIQNTMEIDLTFRVLAYSNSCINPFVYAFISRQFRRSLAKMFPCIKPGQVSPTHGEVVTESNNILTVNTANLVQQ